MDSFVVVYRTGGTENFKWHRSVVSSLRNTEERLDRVAKMGYTCHIAKPNEPLPEKFDAKT